MDRPQWENGLELDRTRDIAIVYGPDFADYFVSKARSICGSYLEDIKTASGKNSGVTDADRAEWRTNVVDLMQQLKDQIDDVHDWALYFHFSGDPWNPADKEDLVKGLESVMKEAGIDEKLT